MAQSATTDFLDVPNAQFQRQSPERAYSIDDVSKLAPELNGKYLTLEGPVFAHGGFSDVYPGRWAPPEHPEGIDVAVKVLRISHGAVDPKARNIKYGKHLGREIFVWQRATHPRITPLIGYIREFTINGVPCIVTKRRQDNLSMYLGKNPGADRIKLLCQALEGLTFLHTFKPNPIIHFDIKPGNILVTQEGDAELCDFGYAKVLELNPSGFTTSPNPGGTYPYMSPEVIDEAEWKDLTPQADIFAMGSTILLILSGKKPWHSLKKASLIRAVQSGTPPARELYPMEGSEEAINLLWELLEKCWSKVPESRPTAEQVRDKLLVIQSLGGVRPPVEPEVDAT